MVVVPLMPPEIYLLDHCLMEVCPPKKNNTETCFPPGTWGVVVLCFLEKWCPAATRCPPPLDRGSGLPPPPPTKGISTWAWGGGDPGPLKFGIFAQMVPKMARSADFE